MKIKFIQEELQLVYEVCMRYGDRLEKVIDILLRDKKMAIAGLADRAKENQKLAIMDKMEQEIKEPLENQAAFVYNLLRSDRN